MAENVVAYDAVVLTGGKASRLGGASKAEIEILGSPLLVHVLGIASEARTTVVVGPESAHHPREFTVVEDPQGGGPVAGLAAGMAALERMRVGAPLPWLLVLACDAPFAGPAVEALEAAATVATADALVAIDGGRRQPLLALYRRAALVEAMAGMNVDGASMRSLLALLTVMEVEAPPGSARDLDTWEDVLAAQGGKNG